VLNPILKDKDLFLANTIKSLKKLDLFKKYIPTSPIYINDLPQEEINQELTLFILQVTYPTFQVELFKNKLYYNKIFN
jgi:hypothetical protein